MVIEIIIIDAFPLLIRDPQHERQLLQAFRALAQQHHLTIVLVIEASLSTRPKEWLLNISCALRITLPSHLSNTYQEELDS